MPQFSVKYSPIFGFHRQIFNPEVFHFALSRKTGCMMILTKQITIKNIKTNKT